MELHRRGYEVYTGRLAQKEIDFVAMKVGKKQYIQVALKLSENMHETDNLLSIQGNYQKCVITYELGSVGEVDGIPIIHIEHFLLHGL